MTGQDVDDLARSILQDPDSVHWVAADFLLWINAGERDIITHKPKANTVTKPITLEPNQCRQDTPAGTIQILDLMTNLGTDGLTPGRDITMVSMDRMRAAKPSWRRDKGPFIRHGILDDRDRTVYYVWPAPQQAIIIEARCCDLPTPIDALSDALTLEDEYQNALAHYTLFMAYAQDSEDAANMSLSQAHYTVYAQTIGIQVAKQKKASAPANSTENPAYPAVDKNGA